MYYFDLLGQKPVVEINVMTNCIHKYVNFQQVLMSVKLYKSLYVDKHNMSHLPVKKRRIS